MFISANTCCSFSEDLSPANQGCVGRSAAFHHLAAQRKLQNTFVSYSSILSVSALGLEVSKSADSQELPQDELCPFFEVYLHSGPLYACATAVTTTLHPLLNEHSFFPCLQQGRLLYCMLGRRILIYKVFHLSSWRQEGPFLPLQAVAAFRNTYARLQGKRPGQKPF